MEDMARTQAAAGLIRRIVDIASRVPREYLGEVRRDMRYASRALIKSPGFALVGIMSMGVGIGLTCYVPARRSARIDPLKALRDE